MKTRIYAAPAVKGLSVFWSGNMRNNNFAIQSETAITAYFSNKQFQLFAFGPRYCKTASGSSGKSAKRMQQSGNGRSYMKTLFSGVKRK